MPETAGPVRQMREPLCALRRTGGRRLFSLRRWFWSRKFCDCQPSAEQGSVLIFWDSPQYCLLLEGVSDGVLEYVLLTCTTWYASGHVSGLIALLLEQFFDKNTCFLHVLDFEKWKADQFQDKFACRKSSSCPHEIGLTAEVTVEYVLEDSAYQQLATDR